MEKATPANANTSPAPPKNARNNWLRRLRIFSIAFVVLAALFGAFGYFAGPQLAKSALVSLLEKQLRRPVAIKAIHINPYAMRVRVEGVSVGDNAGGEAVGFDEMLLDVDISSVIHAAPVVEEFRLVHPRVHVARVAAGRYDISDLLDEWLKPSDTPTPRFSVNNIKITGGSVTFDDRPAGRTHQITDINIALPFISNLAYQAHTYTEPAFSATVNGAPFTLAGKSKPFAEDRESELKLDLQHFDLTKYLAYLPIPLPFTIAGGSLDTDLTLLFRQPPDKPAELGLTGRVTLSGLQLREEGGAPLLNLQRLDVPLTDVAALNGQLHFGAVGIDGLEIYARRARGGALNWLGLADRLAHPATAKPAPQAAAKPEGLKPEGPKAAVKAEAAKPIILTLEGLRLGKAVLHWQDGPAAQLERFELKKIAVNTAKRLVHVDEAGLSGLTLAVTRLADGGIAGLDALGARNAPGAGGKVGTTSAPTATPGAAAKKHTLAKFIKKSRAAKPSKAAKSANPDWTVEVGKTEITGASLRLMDKSLRHPAEQTVELTKLTLGTFSTAPGSETALNLALLLNKKGALNISGPVRLSPLSAKLKLDLRGFELLPLQPYFADKVNLTVTKGQLAADGALEINTASDGGLAGGFKGQLTLGGFHSVDKTAASADFLTWKSLHLGQVNVNLKPLTLAIGEVALSDFYARLIVSGEGKLNVLGLVKKKGGETGKDRAAPGDKSSDKTGDKPASPATSPAPAAQAAQAAQAAAEPAQPSVPVRIGKVTLQGGAVSFTDHFIKPNYTAKLAHIGGRITGLSTDPASTASMDLRGDYEGAPLTIAGTLNPLSASPALDIKTEVRGVELTPMSPYFGKYAGYALEKGKLSLTLVYKIADRKLQAENRVFLDQLTFGDRVESPSATKLPVTLAVALLKNRRGEIDINLPISGSLDDPQFSVGGIIVQVIVNLLGKALTSPFALIGSLFGGGEELSHVDFAPGYAALTPESQKRLENLAKALDDRPALTLEVAGGVDPEKDREGLRHAWMERQVKARKLAQMVRGRKEAGSVDDVVVSPQEYPDLLAQAYKRANFPKPRNFIGLQKSLPQAEMEKLMLANAPVSDDDLRDLANRRAGAVADWLRAGGKIEAGRVFLLPPRRVTDAAAAKEAKKGVSLSRAEFSLK